MALTQTKRRNRTAGGKLISYTYDTTKKIYEGALIGVDSSTGKARPLQQGDFFIGVANADSQSYESVVVVEYEQLEWLPLVGASTDDVSKSVYATDDSTLTLNSATTSRIGLIMQTTTDMVLVRVELRVQSSSTAKSTITVTSDYGASESWMFDEMFCKGTTDITCTFPADISGFPDGSRRVIFNNSANGSIVYLHPNGNEIEGSTFNRLIAPDGYVELAKVDGVIRVLEKHLYYVDIDPDDIDHLELWLDSDDSSTITKDGSNLVSAWDDKSTNNVDFTQSGTNRPLWVDSAQNGKAVIRFDGNNDYMNAGNHSLHSNTRGMTIVLVMKPADTSTDMVLAKYQTTGNNREWYIQTESAHISEDGSYDSSNTSQFANAGVGWQIIELVWEPGDHYRVYVNGSQSATSNNVINDIINGTANLWIGQSEYNYSYLYGDIAEVAVFSDKLTSALRKELRAKLAVKWNVDAVMVGEGVNYWNRDVNDNEITPKINNDNLNIGSGTMTCGTLITSSHTPSSASDTGVAGTIAHDANYIYICTATDTWKRVAITTW